MVCYFLLLAPSLGESQSHPSLPTVNTHQSIYPKSGERSYTRWAAGANLSVGNPCETLRPPLDFDGVSSADGPITRELDNEPMATHG